MVVFVKLHSVAKLLLDVMWMPTDQSQSFALIVMVIIIIIVVDDDDASCHFEFEYL